MIGSSRSTTSKSPKPAKAPRERGRPGLGDTVLRAIRLSGAMDAAIAAFAARQGIDRSEALRRLIERGLKASK